MTREMQAEGWRHFACERINAFRQGACDLDGLYFAFVSFAAAYEAGAAAPRPAVVQALYNFLAAASPYAASPSNMNPPARTFETQLTELQTAIAAGMEQPDLD